MSFQKSALRSIGSLAGAVFALLGATQAQAFEARYGAPTAAENGARGVAPVRFCAGGGFISAGARVQGGSSDVYVVRTAPNGAIMFERFYNIGPATSSDRGTSVVELRGGGGFVVVGSSNASGSEDALFLRLDCNGNVALALTYGATLRESASDVIEAQSGNAAGGAMAGDLVISGQTTNPNGTNTDGFLLRVRPTGALVWQRRYDVNSVNEAFAALTEARPVGASPTGDIITVGNWRNVGAADQAYVVRVSGDTGLLASPNSCAMIYGAGDTERFTGVFESRLGGTAGQLILAGTQTSAAQSNDIYLVRAQPNCTPIVQRRIGAPANAPLGDESASDVKQLTAALAIGPTGAIALTGATGRPTTSAFEASLLSADVTSLIPIQGRLFGDNAGLRDQGVSLFQVPLGQPAGMIIAGFSDSQPGDPRDLYLVRTDVNGNTTCNTSYLPPHQQIALPVSAVPPVTAAFAAVQQWPVATSAQYTVVVKCP